MVSCIHRQSLTQGFPKTTTSNPHTQIQGTKIEMYHNVSQAKPGEMKAVSKPPYHGKDSEVLGLIYVQRILERGLFLMLQRKVKHLQPLII